MSETSPALQFDGVELNEATLPELLYALSRYPPDPMAPSASGSGHRRAAALWELVQGTPLESVFQASVASLWAGDLNTIWLASIFTVPESVEPHLLERALEAAKAQASDFSVGGPEAKARFAAVHLAWTRALQCGTLPFGAAEREQLMSEPEPQLLAAALIWDQDPTIDALPRLLQDNDDSLVAFALYFNLRVSEGRALVEKLRRRQGPVFQQCAALIEEMIADGSLIEHGSPRWEAHVGG